MRKGIHGGVIITFTMFCVYHFLWSKASVVGYFLKEWMPKKNTSIWREKKGMPSTKPLIKFQQILHEDFQSAKQHK